MAAVAAQVEVKLRLPGPEAHQKLEQLLAPGRVATHQQVTAAALLCGRLSFKECRDYAGLSQS